MKAKDVPQHDSMLEGHRRACYAVDDDGRYTIVASKGWEVEKIVNGVAVTDLREQLELTRQRAAAGHTSALEYHMQRRQMDPAMLAANTGQSSWWGVWRVRRHLKPSVFAKLSPELLARYAEVLRLTVDELRQVPTEISRQ